MLPISSNREYYLISQIFEVYLGSGNEVFFFSTAFLKSK